MFDFLKNILGGEDDKNSLSPPKPFNMSTLMCETPENICKQYLSMEAKTNSHFKIAMSNDSFEGFCDSSMRLSAYSTVAVHGFVFYIACMDMNVSRILPKKYNNLIYSQFLLEIYNFSWVMLQHCLFNSDYGKEKFGRKKIISFLESEIAAKAYPYLLMSYLVTQDNAEFAEKKFRELVEVKSQYGEDFSDFPPEKSKNSFDQMVSIPLIGNPNTYQSFNATYQVKTFSDLDLVMDIADRIRFSLLYDTFKERIRLNLL